MEKSKSFSIANRCKEIPIMKKTKNMHRKIEHKEPIALPLDFLYKF